MLFKYPLKSSPATLWYLSLVFQFFRSLYVSMDIALSDITCMVAFPDNLHRWLLIWLSHPVKRLAVLSSKDTREAKVSNKKNRDKDGEEQKERGE